MNQCPWLDPDLDRINVLGWIRFWHRPWLDPDLDNQYPWLDPDLDKSMSLAG